MLLLVLVPQRVWDCASAEIHETMAIESLRIKYEY